MLRGPVLTFVWVLLGVDVGRRATGPSPACQGCDPPRALLVCGISGYQVARRLGYRLGVVAVDPTSVVDVERNWCGCRSADDGL